MTFTVVKNLKSETASKVNLDLNVFLITVQNGFIQTFTIGDVNKPAVVKLLVNLFCVGTGDSEGECFLSHV